MASLVRGAVLAVSAALLFHVTPALAEIELKAGCDGKWVAREGSGFETYMVCERKPQARKVAAIRMRAHRRAVAHVRPHPVAPPPVREVAHEPPLRPFVVAAAPMRREGEASCLTMLCPQFVMVGVGY